MIRVEGLTKRRGARAVVSDVTFRCEPGTVTGFLGPNGAGKSATMRMLVGLSAPDSGEARILGGATATCRTPDDASASSWTRRRSTQGAGAARPSPSPPTPSAYRRGASTKCSSSSASTRRRPGGESANTRSACAERLGLAHALLGDPEVLILDEPATGCAAFAAPCHGAQHEAAHVGCVDAGFPCERPPTTARRALAPRRRTQSLSSPAYRCK
jgi:ABC-2 type transport system ATP-binding protein